MPRTRFDKKKFDKLLVLIHGNAIVNNKTYEDLGRMAGCSSRTMYRRLSQPEEMTLNELTRVCRGLNIPIEELRQSITY